MGDKSDHMIAADDEISFLKESNPTGQNQSLKKRSPPLNLKPLSFFFSGRRPDGILRHHETLQLETEWLIYTPSPPHIDTGDEKGSCLLSEAGVVGLNGEKMSSWKNPSTSCPRQCAYINTTCSSTAREKLVVSQEPADSLSIVLRLLCLATSQTPCVSERDGHIHCADHDSGR